MDPVVKALADSLLANPVSDLLWKMHIKVQDVKILFSKNNFWTDVLKAWTMFNYQCTCNRDAILGQILWFNSDLRRNGVPFIAHSLWSKGIVYVQDIVNTDFSFKTIAQIREQFPGVDILEYISLIECIPMEWKRWIKNDSSQVIPPPKFELIQNQSSLVSIAYKDLNCDAFLLLDKMDKWRVKFDKPIFYKDFVKVGKRIWSMTNCSKLPSFQYRILMNTLVTNVSLFRWRVPGITPYCTFCSNYTSIM